MKKIILLLAMTFSFAYAEGINWVKDYKTALYTATSAKKPVMFLLSSTGCKWCTHMKENALSDPRVVAKLNSEFIAVDAYTHIKNFPSTLLTQGTPATWFLTPMGEPMYQPMVGSMDAENFLNALDIVLTTFKTPAAAAQSGGADTAK